MPAQTTALGLVEYALFDTAPSLRAQLTDGDGDPIDLTQSDVVINISPTQGTYGTSDPTRLVDGAACVVDADQVNNKGYVDWNPAPDALDRFGSYSYNFEVTYADNRRQTISPKAENVLIVRFPVGGTKYGEQTTP
jgi:hypothetical protein